MWYSSLIRDTSYLKSASDGTFVDMSLKVQFLNGKVWLSVEQDDINCINNNYHVSHKWYVNPSHKFEHNIDLLVKTTFITYLLWNKLGFFQPMLGKSSFSEFGLISNNLDKPHIKFNLSLRKSLTIPLHKSKVHYASRQDQLTWIQSSVIFVLRV